jgi:predicted RNA polymerase sigma factor
MLHHRLAEDGEVTGLLALMLLTDARRDERTRPDGALVPLDEQDRSRWNHALIDEGVALLTGVLGQVALGPYQLQAAIAAVHDEAPSADDTDWREILELYELLDRIAPNPMVTLNRVVAVAEVHGPDAALALLSSLDGDARIADHHRTYSVRAHLLERTGDVSGARAAYLEAARRTTSRPEQRHLESRAARLR